MFTRKIFTRNIAILLGGYCLLAGNNATADTLTGSYSIGGTQEATETITQNSLAMASDTMQSYIVGDKGGEGATFPGALVLGDLSTNTTTALIAGTNKNAPSAIASLIYTTTITNNSATVQNYNFDFNLSNIGFGGYVDNSLTSSTGALSISVALDGSDVWSASESETVYTDAPGFTHYSYAATNPVLENSLSYLDYAPNVSVDVPLGSLNPNQSETLTYTLTASASVSDDYDQCSIRCGSALAEFGTPISWVNSTGGSDTFGVTPSAVPEPAEEALLAVGFGAATLLARRKKMARK